MLGAALAADEAVRIGVDAQAGAGADRGAGLACAGAAGADDCGEGRDGTRDGYDLGLVRRVCEAVSIPVVAAALTRDLTLLAFDEMVINNSADAMILSRLFTAILDAALRRRCVAELR